LDLIQIIDAMLAANLWYWNSSGKATQSFSMIYHHSLHQEVR